MLSEEEAIAVAKEHGISEQMATLSVFRVLLNHPAVAKALVDTLMTLLFRDNKLDVRFRELIIMRIGWATGSVYEWTQHWRVAVGLDIPEEDLLAVKDWQNSERLSPADKAILKATDEALQDGKVSDETWQDCVTHLKSRQEQIELIVAIGNWTLFSQMLQSLNIPLEPGVEPWPPGGEAP